MESNILANKIKEILDNKKAIDIEIIDLREKKSFSDFFVLATGTSSTHIKSLADEVESELEKEEIYPDHCEGKISNSWIVIDYNNVVLHIFSKEARELYDLEKLWK